MGGELAKVIEDFLRAVDVEALRTAKGLVSIHCLNIAWTHPQ
jgi:hypothetical protein